MEKKYTVGEIILGLRPEYQKSQQDLEKLKRYFDVNPKKVSDFCFRADRSDIISCYYDINESNIRRLINEFLIRIGRYVYHSDSFDIFDENGIIQSSDKQPIFLKDNLTEAERRGLINLVNRILNSEFIKNMDSVTSDFYIQTLRLFGIYLSSSRVNFSRVKFNAPRTSLEYDAVKDTISFTSEVPLIDTKSIRGMLDTELSSDVLNEYQIDVIEANRDRAKNLEIAPIKPTDQVELEIVDYTNIYLRRKRKQSN